MTRWAYGRLPRPVFSLAFSLWFAHALALEIGGVLCDEAADLAALLEDRLPLVRVERDREAADPVQGQSPFTRYDSNLIETGFPYLPLALVKWVI